MSDVKFFCYWSHLPEYEALAHKCAESFARFDITVNVKELKSQGNWMKNCMARSVAFYDEAIENPESTVVLLDSDLDCVADPVLLKTFDGSLGDIAIHDKFEGKHTRYCPGIFAVAPTTGGRECLRKWASICDSDLTPDEWLREQVYLYMAIEQMKQDGYKFKVFNLGWEYNSVPNVPCEKPVIKHGVASRKLLTKVGGRR